MAYETDLRLDRHLGRVRVAPQATADAATKYQTAMLRYFLDVLESALNDAGVYSDTAARVVQHVIYGCSPQPHTAQLVQTMKADALRGMATGAAWADLQSETEALDGDQVL